MPDHPDDPRHQRRSSVLPPFVAPRTPRTTIPTQPSGASTTGSGAGRHRFSRPFTPPAVIQQTRSTPPAMPPLGSRNLQDDAPLAAESTPTPPASLPSISPEAITSDATEPSWGLPLSAAPSESTNDTPNDASLAGSFDAEPMALGFGIEESTADSFGGAVDNAPTPPATPRIEPERFWAAESVRAPSEFEPAEPEPGDVPQDHSDDSFDLVVESSDAAPWSDDGANSRAAGDELTDALAWPEAAAPLDGSVEDTTESEESGARHEALAGDASEGDASEGDALSQVAPELRDAATSWPDAAPEPAPPAPHDDATPPALADTIAAALERIAERVRAGTVPLSADLPPGNDAGALAAVLAALLRGSGDDGRGRSSS